MEKSAHRLPTWMALLWSVTTLGWWALAFYPAGQASPQWLETAQNVCFGTLENGLPAAYGWLMLLGMPSGLGAALAVTYTAEYRQALKTGSIKVLALLVLVLFLAEAGWIAGRVRQGLEMNAALVKSEVSEPLPPTYPMTNKALPDFKLVDQHGKTITPRHLKGKPTILTFAFAHCATVCPLLVRDARLATETVGQAGVQPVFITLDPWRDKPSRLPSLAKSWALPSNGRVLSGEVAQVTKALDGLKVPRQRDELTGEVAHPALVYVLNKDGNIAYTFNNPPVSWLVEAVHRLEKT